MGHSIGDGLIVAALAATAVVWLMRDLRWELIVAALAIGVPIAAGASAYGRRLAVD